MSKEYMESAVVKAAFESFAKSHLRVSHGAYCNSEEVVLAFMCSIIYNEDLDKSRLSGVLDAIIEAAEDEYYRDKEDSRTSVFTCVQKADKTLLIINLELSSFPSGAPPHHPARAAALDPPTSS